MCHSFYRLTYCLIIAYFIVSKPIIKVAALSAATLIFFSGLSPIAKQLQQPVRDRQRITYS
jgi:hypothetical protein